VRIRVEEEKETLVKLSDVVNMEKINDLGFNSRKDFLLFYFKNLFISKNKLKLSVSYIIYKLSCKKKL